jgi:hypothetical protein
LPWHSHPAQLSSRQETKPTLGSASLLRVVRLAWCSSGAGKWHFQVSGGLPPDMQAAIGMLVHMMEDIISMVVYMVLVYIPVLAKLACLTAWA